MPNEPASPRGCVGIYTLDPGWTPPTKWIGPAPLREFRRMSSMTGLVADLANRLVDHLRRLTVEVDELAAEITSQATVFAPSLLAIPGCAALTAAKIFGEAAQVYFRARHGDSIVADAIGDTSIIADGGAGPSREDTGPVVPYVLSILWSAGCRWFSANRGETPVYRQ